MKKITSLLSFMLLVCASAALAQDITGTIVGTVTDPSGSAVPGAQVTIFNLRQNHTERVLTTDAAGDYTAPYLPVSTYRVSIEAKGFKKAVREDIVLNVNDKLTVSFFLEVGDV